MKDTTLNLTLKRLPFEATAKGEKIIEVRKPSRWIMSRLKGRDYAQVKFTHGYGNSRPSVTLRYQGYTIAVEHTQFTFSNGLVVDVQPGDVLISIGQIIELR